MTEHLDDLVSKSDFAKICNVSAGRVSQWIRENKITGAALVGTGQRARIRRSIAQEQLKARLDVGQRFGMNGLATKLETPVTPVAAIQLPGYQAPVTLPLADTSTDERIKAERLRQSEITTRKMAEEEAARRGLYVLAADVQKQMNVLGDQMMAQFTGAMNELANAIAAEFSLVPRDVLHTMRTTYRAIRTKQAAALGQEAAALPETTEHTLAETDA